MIETVGGLLDNLGQLILTHQALSHYIIAGGMLIQGEVTILVSSYLIISGSLKWLDFLIPAFLAVVLSDYALYFFGKFSRDTRIGWKVYKKMKRNKTAQFYSYYISQNLKKIIILTKFLVGTNFVVFFSIGWTKVKFRKFFKTHIISVTVWFTVTVIISFFLAGGLHLLKAEKIFKEAEIGIAIAIILMIGGESLLKKFLQKTFIVESKAKAVGEKIENSTLENMITQGQKDDILENSEMGEMVEKQKEHKDRVKSKNIEKIFKK